VVGVITLSMSPFRVVLNVIGAEFDHEPVAGRSWLLAGDGVDARSVADPAWRSAPCATM
jgi:hypothetical protein